MLLKEIAHSRTGDKGNISVISVIAYKDEDYALIKEKVTEEKLKDYFKDIVHGKITRYEMPTISALNFVLEDALGGGVTRSLAIDMHGKTLGSALLEMEIDQWLFKILLLQVLEQWAIQWLKSLQDVIIMWQSMT